MDQETSEATFTGLANALRSTGMGWIVDQVFESISEGKGLQAVSARSRKNAKLVRSEEIEVEARGNVYRRRLEEMSTGGGSIIHLKNGSYSSRKR